MGGFAWVTLTTNDSYSLGALVLAHSLRRAGTKYDLAVLVTPGVTEVMREKLAAVFSLVQEVNVLDSKDEANLALLARPELGITFTKLHCWRLTQYEKCVFVDADALVIKNCDELFEYDELSAAPDVGWPDCFNSGVFVFKPSQQTFASITAFAAAKGSFDGGDQGLLNLYFSDWARKDISKHLPFIYNMCSTASYSYLPAFKQYGEDVRIIHFIGATKPWLQYFDTQTGIVQPPSGSHHLQPLLQIWWNIFCENVYPQLSPVMASSTLASIWHKFTPPPPRSTVLSYPPYQSTNYETYFDNRPPTPPHTSNVPDFAEFCDPWENYQPQHDTVTYIDKEENQNQQYYDHTNRDYYHQPPQQQQHSESHPSSGQIHSEHYQSVPQHHHYAEPQSSHKNDYQYQNQQPSRYRESHDQPHSHRHPNKHDQIQEHEQIQEHDFPQHRHYHNCEENRTEHQQQEQQHYDHSHVPHYDEKQHNHQQGQNSQQHEQHIHYHHEQHLVERYHHNEHSNENNDKLDVHFQHNEHDFHEPDRHSKAHHNLHDSNIAHREKHWHSEQNNFHNQEHDEHDKQTDTSHPPCEPCTDPQSIATQSEQNIAKQLENKDAGLAGALAQMTLGEPRSPEQTALEEHMRQQSWEQGQIDYMGRDCFDNIWKKICDTLSQAPSNQPSPSEDVPEQEKPKAKSPTPTRVSDVKIESTTATKGLVEEQPQVCERPAGGVSKQQESSEVSVEGVTFQPSSTEPSEIVTKTPSEDIKRTFEQSVESAIEEPSIVTTAEQSSVAPEQTVIKTTTEQTSSATFEQPETKIEQSSANVAVEQSTLTSPSEQPSTKTTTEQSCTQIIAKQSGALVAVEQPVTRAATEKSSVKPGPEQSHKDVVSEPIPLAAAPSTQIIPEQVPETAVPKQIAVPIELATEAVPDAVQKTNKSVELATEAVPETCLDTENSKGSVEKILAKGGSVQGSGEAVVAPSEDAPKTDSTKDTISAPLIEPAATVESNLTCTIGAVKTSTSDSIIIPEHPADFPTPIKVAESIIQTEPKESVSEDPKPVTEEVISSIVAPVQESATAVSETLAEPKNETKLEESLTQVPSETINNGVDAVPREVHVGSVDSAKESEETETATAQVSEPEAATQELQGQPEQLETAGCTGTIAETKPKDLEGEAEEVEASEEVSTEEPSISESPKSESESPPESPTSENPVRPARVKDTKVPATPTVIEATPPTSPPIGAVENLETQPKVVKKVVKKTVKKTIAEGEPSEATEGEGSGKKVVKKIVKKVVKKPKETPEDGAECSSSTDKTKKTVKISKKVVKPSESLDVDKSVPDTPPAGNTEVPVPPKRKTKTTTSTKTTTARKTDPEP